MRAKPRGNALGCAVAAIGLAAAIAALGSALAVAAPRERTSAGYHCEKKGPGGAYADALSVRSRKACKKGGGRWVKGHDAARPAPAPKATPSAEPSAEPASEGAATDASVGEAAPKAP